MADNLGIRLIAKLNKDSSKAEINRNIAKLEGDLDKIKLNIQLDDKILKTLSDFVKSMERYKEAVKEQNKLLREEKSIVKELDGSINELSKKFYKNGEIRVTETKRTNKQSQALKDEANAIKNVSVELDKLSNKQRRSQRLDSGGNLVSGSVNVGDAGKNATINYDKDFNVTSQTVNDNYKAQQQAVERLRQSLTSLFNQGKVSEAFFKNFNKAIDTKKSVSEVNKLQESLKRVQTFSDTKNLQQKMITEAETLLRTHKKSVDTEGVENLVARLKEVPPTAVNASNQIKGMGRELDTFKAKAKDATRHSMSFGESMHMAFQKFPVEGIFMQE